MVHRIKHHLNRYTAGSGNLDWADQPAPVSALSRLRTHYVAPEASLPIKFFELDRFETFPVLPLTSSLIRLPGLHINLFKDHHRTAPDLIQTTANGHLLMRRYDIPR